MARVMYDSTSAADIPAGALMVAGYDDGLYAWSDADWNRHPRAVQVHITVTGDNLDSHVADYERGNLLLPKLVSWVKAKGARGDMPTVYFSLGLYGEIEAAFKAAGIGNQSWLTWVADWNGQANLEPGWTAHQYADSAMTGHHYDLSVAADYWPGVDPPPGVAPPAPAPGPPEHQVALAWAALGDVLGSVLPGLNNALAATAGRLSEL